MADIAAWEFMQIVVDESDGSWNAVGPTEIKAGGIDEHLKGLHLVAGLLSTFGTEGWQLAGILPAVGETTCYSLLLQRHVPEAPKASFGFGAAR